MNSILIAMFVFICGLVVLLIYQISRLMETQEDLRGQLDAIHKYTVVIQKTTEIQFKSQREIENEFAKVESSLHDIDRNIDILHAFLEEDTNTILKAISINNDDIDAISSYLEIMKNTILDMNDKMNKPTCGDEVNDTEEVDLIPEHWTLATPSYTEDETI